MLTPKLWALLNLAHQDASFGTLQSPIGHMVPKILTAGKIPEEQQQEQQEQQQEYITFLRDRFEVYYLDATKYYIGTVIQYK